MAAALLVLGLAARAAAMHVNHVQFEVRSASFYVSPMQCIAFATNFTGGDKKKMVVDVTDSNKKLSYIAVGTAHYNNKDTYGDPESLENCGTFNADPETPTCWGAWASNIDASGWYNSCNQGVEAVYTEMDGQSSASLAFMASDHDGCKTLDGVYYVYAYATGATEVTVKIENGGTGDTCGDAKAAVIAIIVLSCICPCLCICASCCAAFFIIKNQQEQQRRRALMNASSSAGMAAAATTMPGAVPTYGQTAGGPPVVVVNPTPVYGQPTVAAQPVMGNVVMGNVVGAPPVVAPGVVVGSVVPPPPPAYGGDVRMEMGKM